MIKNKQTLKEIGSIISLAQSIAHQVPFEKNKESQPPFLSNIMSKEFFIKLIYIMWMNPKDSFFEPRKKEGKKFDKRKLEWLFSKYEQQVSGLYRKTKTKKIKNIVNPKKYNDGDGHWFSERSLKKGLNFWARAEKTCPETINKFFLKTNELVKSNYFSESITELENFLFDPPFYRRSQISLRPLVQGIFNLCLKNALGSKKHENALIISEDIMLTKHISNNFKHTTNIINPIDYSMSILKADLLKKQRGSKTTSNKTFSFVNKDMLKSNNIEDFSKQDFDSPGCIINDRSFGISPFYRFSQGFGSGTIESPATKANVAKYTSLLNKGGAYFLLLNRYQLKNMAFDELIESGLTYAARVLDVVILCFSPNTPETKNPELVYFEDLETRFLSLQTEYKEIYSKDSISLRESTSKYLKLFEKELNKTSPQIIKRVPEEDLIEKNFSIPRFFAPVYDGVKLGTHCKILKGTMPDSKEGPVVSSKDLGYNNLKPLDTTILSKEDTKGTKKISETCVLLSRRGLKPTFFEYKDSPIHIKKSVVAIKAKNDNVLNKHLIIELLSKDVQAQINYITHNTVAYITNKDVLSLVIDPPGAVEEQKKQIKNVERVIAQVEEREVALKQVIEGKLDNQHQKIKSLKHHIADHAFYIKDNLEVVETIIKDYQEKEINEFFSRYRKEVPIKLKQRIKSVLGDIDLITKLLKKLKEGVEYTEKDFPLTFFSYKEFISLNKEIIQKKSESFDKQIDFLQEKTESPDETGLYDEIGLYINKNAYKIFLREFIKNTEKHAGFNPVQRQINIFKIKLSYNQNEGKIGLTIMDNGLGLGKLTKEKFTEWGTDSKEGTGIGGSDIDEISKLFQVISWRIDHQDKEFSTKFVFEIPLRTKKQA